MAIEDMYGNKIEFGTAVADRAVSITINEPKFGHEVLIRLNVDQARDFAKQLVDSAKKIKELKCITAL